MADVTRTELNQQTARVLARVEAGEDVTVTDRGRPIARITPVESDRRARRIAGGALRPAAQNGIPAISSPLRDWSTQQMIEDMRGERS
ncbi:type II toxin-antitoxin system Phd/YefM family antitoxin [Brachybacterium sp. FME24]|uniref:type II toxin-antitoxin system Phd/YefM family antitoxin n=1 Tax=Brachybacterium sp. FME24 TaxID=2742605 RepID=UPI001869113A|nr:type II toxin-antitoxin system prevent-host-death family antitoxin [Brachybacterium sp. FME24]